MSPFPPKSTFTWIWRWIFPPALASNSNNSFRIMVFSRPFTLSAFQGRSSFYWLTAAIFKQLLQLINVVGFSVYAMCTLHEPDRHSCRHEKAKSYFQGKRMVNSRLRDPGFKIRHWDLSVFINSEPETLLLKNSEPRDSKRQKFRMVQISKAN